MKELPVGGIVPFTAIDYPGALSLVVFCQGCPWQCHYCHNTHLQPFTSGEKSRIPWEKVVALLRRRVGLLDAVVFSGGEPTAHEGLLASLKDVRDLGFKVGIHTGGGYPNRFKALLPFVDWIGFDIKAPFDKYEGITQTFKSGERARISALLLLESGVSYEFRTTFHPHLLSEADLEEIASSLAGMGAKKWVIQEFRKEGCTNKELIGIPSLPMLRPSLQEKFSMQFASFQVRNRAQEIETNI